MKTRTLSIVLAVLLAPSGALAAGTALDVQSGRGTGMAAAMTGWVDDSSAIYFNPAGIARGKIFDAQVGITPIVPAFKYTNPGGKETSMPFAIIPPVNAYVSGGVTDDLSLGVGLFSPYGLSLEWPSDWEGRRLITKASLQTFYINPTAAYRIGPVRLGAGVQIVRGTVDLQRKIAFGDQEGSTELGAGTWGVGGNAGVQIDAVPKKLMMGVAYRSAVTLDFDGNAHFENVPPELAGTIHDQAVKTSLTLPDQLAFGVAASPIKDLIVDADLVWLSWDKFRSVDIEFPNDASHSLASSEPKNWHGTYNFHLGAEGKIAEVFRLRGGFMYDPSPSPPETLTPDIPDANRLNLAIGGSYVHPSGVRLDLGYQFIVLFSKHSSAPGFNGDYGGNVDILGVSLGYRTPSKASEAY